MIRIKYDNRIYDFELNDEFSLEEDDSNMMIELINVVINSSKIICLDKIEISYFNIAKMDEDEADLFTENFLKFKSAFHDLNNYMERIQQVPCNDWTVKAIIYKKALYAEKNSFNLMISLDHVYDEILEYFVEKFDW